jgi:predicted DCC family thiol-disulfide oxidoreductase YuxK
MVAFVLAHERAPVARFVGAWSDEGREISRAHGISPDRLNETFVVIAGGRAHLASDGALEIADLLAWPWRGARILRLCPRLLRDSAYYRIARHRLHFFGRQCFVPPHDMRWRFVGMAQRERRAPQ